MFQYIFLFSIFCSFTFAAQKSTTDVPMCSHQEATQGLTMDFMVTIHGNINSTLEWVHAVHGCS